jgi:cytidylate kinase
MASGIHLIIERQIQSWELEARMRRQAAKKQPGRPTPMRPYVAISRAFGSGGGEIARRLGAKLGYHIFDREILDILVKEGRFRTAILDSLEERDRSAFEVWVDGLLRGRLAHEGDYMRTLAGVLGSIAMHGHAVILGRGANFILDPGRGLHVRIVAPVTQRIETISRLRSVDHEEAKRLVQRTDRQRASFVKRSFDADLNDPLAYDIILNTAGLGIEAAVNLTERTLRMKLGGKANVQF